MILQLRYSCQMIDNIILGDPMIKLAAMTQEAWDVGSSADEHRVVARIAAGDQLAMRSLYGRHHVRLHRFLLRMVRDVSAAEDILAEVFLDVWRQAGRFEGRSSVNTWLCGIARNKALAHLRNRPPPATSSDDLELEDAADTPEVSAQKLSKSERLRQCVGRLGQEHRDVIDLVYYHEKSVEEVGLILKIPVNTVKTRMFYARKKLSDMFASAGIDRGWP